ncbi:hypothetical protein ACIP5N_23200 [Streptomyces sp. NPDC088768]|uniref:hypothetical protein n=1 Tax=Streptomyces sp. NPDC088768 TaxID=3365894 RepID=UPI0038259CC0
MRGGEGPYVGSGARLVGAAQGLLGVGVAAEREQGLGGVGPREGRAADEPVARADPGALGGDAGGVGGAADASEHGGEVRDGAREVVGGREREGALPRLVQLGEPAVDVPCGDAEDAARDVRGEFGVDGADHAGVGDGAFGGDEAVGPRFVDHLPAREVREDFGVDVGGRQSAHEFLGAARLGAAVAAAGRGGEARAAGQEPGGAQRVGFLFQEPQGAPDEGVGAPGLAAHASGGGGLGEEVEGSGGARCGLGHLVARFQGAVEVVELFGVRVPGAGARGGPRAGPWRARARRTGYQYPARRASRSSARTRCGAASTVSA